jgi:hypothetical protein
MAASCDPGSDGIAYRSVANPKGNIMKTELIASLLIATSFAASAMYERMNTVPMNKQSWQQPQAPALSDRTGVHDS